MINRLAVGFWKACLCQFAWRGRIFKVGLAFIAGRRGTEGGSHPGPELSAPWYIRIAKRGSGGELKLTTLQNSGVWCWSLWADAMATAVVTKMSPHEPHRSQSLLRWKELPHDKSESLKTFLSYHYFLCFRGSPCSEVGAKARYWALSLFPFTSSGWMKTPWVWFGLVWTSDTGNEVVRPYFFARSLLSIERKQRRSCGTLWLLQVPSPLPTLPFSSIEDGTPRSYSLWPEKSIQEANDLFEGGFSTSLCLAVWAESIILNVGRF